MFESAIVRCLVITPPTWNRPEWPITIGRLAVLPEVPVIQLLPHPLFYHPYAS